MQSRLGHGSRADLFVGAWGPQVALTATCLPTGLQRVGGDTEDQGEHAGGGETFRKGGRPAGLRRLYAIARRAGGVRRGRVSTEGRQRRRLRDQSGSGPALAAPGRRTCLSVLRIRLVQIFISEME